jgi:hypothetical protein
MTRNLFESGRAAALSLRASGAQRQALARRRPAVALDGHRLNPSLSLQVLSGVTCAPSEGSLLSTKSGERPELCPGIPTRS